MQGQVLKQTKMNETSSVRYFIYRRNIGMIKCDLSAFSIYRRDMGMNKCFISLEPQTGSVSLNVCVSPGPNSYIEILTLKDDGIRRPSLWEEIMS